MASPKKPTRRSERALAFQVLYGLAFSPTATRTEVIRLFNEAPAQMAEREAPDQPAVEADRPPAAKGRKKPAEPAPPAAPVAPPEGFAWELVEGVWERQQEIDALLAKHSQNWRVERMGKVEVTLLRLALFELGFRPDIPARVTINEAIELSKQFGDEGSRAFVNGILDAVSKELEKKTTGEP